VLEHLELTLRHVHCGEHLVACFTRCDELDLFPAVLERLERLNMAGFELELHVHGGLRPDHRREGNLFGAMPGVLLQLP